MWKCHHCPPHENGRRGEPSQKAIKICNHLYPLLRLIHLSGEWFCPYPPKATNLFSCLSPCIKMNPWNSQTFFLSFFTPFLSSVLVSCWLNLLFWFLFISPLPVSPPPPPPPCSLRLSQCLSVLTFSSPQHLLFLSLFLSPFHCVRNVYTNPIQIISRKEGAKTRLCQWQFNPWWARWM